jgi:2-polyprenyl-6-methoxyphenol hydroxylase-like FAD-dependent oxidoreductase
MALGIKVLIVGGGIGGLTLGILLERAGIEYLILERATSFKPLGSVINIGPGVQPLMEQLGIMSDFEEVSKPAKTFNFVDENLAKIGQFDLNFQEDR